MEPKTNSSALAVVTPGDQYKNLSLEEIKHVAGAMVGAGMFPDLDSANTAYVKIMAGQEMGIAPFQAVTGIHIIKGRATLAANLMATKVMQSGKYRYRVKTMTAEVCSIDFQEREGIKWTHIGNSTFTKEDAAAAGTQNMQKYARNMLFARALSNGVKWYTPDVFGGAPVYVEGEFDNEIQADADAAADARTERMNTARMAGQKASPAADSVADQVAEPDTAASAPAQPGAMDEIRKTNEKPDPAEDVVSEDPVVETPMVDDPQDVPHTATQRKRIMAMLTDLGFTIDTEKKAVYTGITGKSSMKDLNKVEAEKLIGDLEKADAQTLRDFYVDATEAE